MPQVVQLPPAALPGFVADREDGPLVSFVVPLYNHLELTQAMLASLRETTGGVRYEIMLIDDGSTDGTREWLRSLAEPDLRVVLNESNLGYAAANNLGAQLARGTFLALLNNDLRLLPGWLEPMLGALRLLGDRTGVVGNVQLRIEDGSIDHSGIGLTPQGKLVHRTDLPDAELRESFAVTAACCLVRRTDFLEVGGFDTAFRNGGEDVDLCLKLRARGKPSRVALKSRVLHHVSASRGGTSPQDERNSRELYRRWHRELAEALAALHATGPRAPFAAQLAESALWREEARWRLVLDETDLSAQGACLGHKGFHISAPGSPAYLRSRALLRLTPGFPTRNLFLAGHCEAPQAGFPSLGLEVLVNGIPCVQKRPLPTGDFNLEIAHPPTVPERETLVELRLLGVPPSHRWLRFPARLLAWLPLPASLRARVEDLARDRLPKRLRLSALVADDRTVLDLRTLKNL